MGSQIGAQTGLSTLFPIQMEILGDSLPESGDL